MVNVSLISVFTIVLGSALANPLGQSSLVQRDEAQLDAKSIGVGIGAGIGIGGGLGLGISFSATVSGLQSGCNTLAAQIRSCRNAISGAQYEVVVQQIQQLASTFSSFFNTFMSCQSCLESQSITSFGSPLQSLFIELQSLISFCRQRYSYQFGTLISPLTNLNGLIGNFFTRIQSSGLGFNQCLPGGITSTFSSIGWSSATTIISSHGFQ